jgi:hypothetical protein
MKQKYKIVKDINSKELLIKEFAVLASNPRRKDLPTILEEDYALLSEQTYDNKEVKESISQGKIALIAFLRNSNFFPVGWCIDKIADSVITMFDSKEEQSEELVFDDKNFIAQHLVEREMPVEVELEEILETSDDIDKLLTEDETVEVDASKTTPNNNHEQLDEEKH